jgi:transposase
MEMSMAFLKRSRRSKNGCVYESWSIVESVRTANGPRQRTIATLGKAPEYEAEERLGWEDVVDQLSGRGPGRRGGLFESSAEPPAWAHVDLRKVRVERLRRLGDVLLALTLWKRLRLGVFFEAALTAGREQIPWSMVACLHTVARFCEPSSDWAIADSFFPKTALGDLLGLAPDKIYENRLYRGLDAVLPCRRALFSHLKTVYGELFGACFDILLYDVTSTYFEGQAEGNVKAARGYSRDSRPDCQQVCIGLVVTSEQLPLAFEVFAGNRTDVTTVEDIFEVMEATYGRARRIWVLDRGMVSEENLEELRRRGASYLVGTPRSMLRRCERELLTGSWEQVQPGVEIKEVFLPSEGSVRERYMLCRSADRVEKDRAIMARAASRLEVGLTALQTQIRSGRERSRERTERRVGRLLERYSRAGRLFKIQIAEADGRLTMKLRRNTAVEDWVALQNGCYLLRTNVTELSPAELWRTYIGLTEAEAAFRQLKGPLGLRPVYHHKDSRTEAHIFIAFLALCLRRSLALWMKARGLGTAPQKLLEELRQVHSLDVVLTAKQDTEIRLRVVGVPEESTRVLLHRLGLRLPNRPKIIENVVATLPS